MTFSSPGSHFPVLPPRHPQQAPCRPQRHGLVVRTSCPHMQSREEGPGIAELTGSYDDGTQGMRFSGSRGAWVIENCGVPVGPGRPGSSLWNNTHKPMEASLPRSIIWDKLAQFRDRQPKNPVACGQALRMTLGLETRTCEGRPVPPLPRAS